MLTSKFNLYNTEWTDRVFDDRNKAYGAYELRHNYSNTMVKAMAIAFLGVGMLCAASIILRTAPTGDKVIHVISDPFIQPPAIAHPKEIKPPVPPKHIKAETICPAAATKFVEMVVKPNELADNPPKNAELTGNIGQVTVKGPVSPPSLPVETPPGKGTLSDESVYNPIGLEFMPEPVGGAAAWNKFLSKNLRFPAAAQEEGVGGRVFLSFIIEKDGTLSHITVDQPAGHGFDEEALRVLKLAKAWTPGRQNGQPVRVKYSIPISFQAPEL
ncbi:MAG: TonB family protein [Mucilaginibacter sp.]